MKYEKSCGAVIFDNDKVLVIQQVAGHWGFPKGHVEKGEKEIETAIREVKEETNIDVRITDNTRYTVEYMNRGLLKQVVFFLAEPISFDLKPQSEEITVIEWLSFEDAIERFTHDNVRELFIRVLKEKNLTPADIYLEITESAYSEDAARLIEAVNHLRDMGFKIEMDDFGSGYSSLNMITTIPIDVLKMDMSFVRNMNKDEKCLKLVELVISIAKFLNVPVVAEGVEDAGQVEALKKMGCDIIQGYYFSKPLPAEEFAALLKKELGGKN